MRCGDAVDITAVATTTRAGGNTGGPSTSNSRSATPCPVVHDDRCRGHGTGDPQAGRHHQVTGESQATAGDGGDEEHQRPRHRCPEHQPPQRVEESGHVGHCVRDGLLELGEQPRRQASDDHHQRADDGDDSIGRSTRPRLVLRRGEQLETERTPLWWPHGPYDAVPALMWSGVLGGSWLTGRGHWRRRSTVGWARSVTISTMPRDRKREMALRAIT